METVVVAHSFPEREWMKECRTMDHGCSNTRFNLGITQARAR